MQKAILGISKQCKHSVRFDAEKNANKVVTSIYLMREAYEALGQPVVIEVSINAAQKEKKDAE